MAKDQQQETEAEIQTVRVTSVDRRIDNLELHFALLARTVRGSLEELSTEQAMLDGYMRAFLKKATKNGSNIEELLRLFGE